MLKKMISLILVLTLVFTGFPAFASNSASAAAKPTYTVSPGSKTYKGTMMNFSTYNSSTKHYYLLRSYLERLEKTGGGTLVLSKGTYTISNTLYVPSNVTIRIKNGAKIMKGTKTGTGQFKAAKSIFQLIRPSRSAKKNIYGGYNGEKNVHFIGEGNATIDLRNDKDSIAIIAGHNQNISIKGIQFLNMYSGHFLEVDAVKKGVISGNTFKNAKASANSNKEAINIDTPDKTTKGWSQDWSKYDKTPNSGLTIENNSFYNLERAIGTHKYSGGSYHDKVTIRNNKIEKTRQDAIRVMNWSNAIIENNTIRDVAPGPNKDYRGILASGAHNPTFRNNTFVNMPRAMQFLVWKNSGPGSQYATTYNKISAANKNALKTNTIVNGLEDIIRINKKYQKFDYANTDTVQINTEQFADLKKGDNGYTETMALVKKNVIGGYGDSTFRPYEPISRAHVAVMLTRALELPTPSNKTSVLSIYKDVDETHPYANQIAAVTKASVFGGNGKFNPNARISREQMASVLVRAFEMEDNEANVEFADMNKIDSSHKDNVRILAQNNITKGKVNKHGDPYFDGRGALMRVQFAVFLNKGLELSI